jgi:CheY-specific phosphatase CheX
LLQLAAEEVFEIMLSAKLEPLTGAESVPASEITDQANQQVWDAIGEICNMVAGNFKNKLTGLSDKYMLSVPTVITGGDYTVHSLADAGTMEIVMTFENSPVLIALEVHS